MSLDDRKLEVLRAIVEDYVATQEPVGSKALVERHHLGVSPATVRNDMAVLEEEGYIRQPHTSAGRVPTDRGYRLFVDRLSRVKPLTPGRAPGDRAVPGRRGRPRRRGAPHGAAARPAHPPGRRRAVPEPGPVRRAPPGAGADLHHPAHAGDDRRHRPGRAAAGRAARAGARRRRHRAAPQGQREARPGSGWPTRRRWCRRWSTRAPPEPAHDRWPCLASVLLETLVERSEERLALAGTANLTRGGVLDFQGTLRPVLEALEEEVILLKLIGEVEPSTTRVRIGDENEIDDLRSTSVVSTGYGPGSYRSSVGWACSAPPAWTTPAPSPPCVPWHATSATCWHRTDGSAQTIEQTCQGHAWRRTTTEFSASAGTPPTTRSSGPTASWPASTTRTSTRTRRRTRSSRTSTPRTRCSPTTRSGRSSTSAATRWRPAAAARAAPVRAARSSASRTSWTRSSAPRRRARGPRPRTRPGADAILRLELDLVETAFGVEAPITVDTAVLCTTCSGAGTAPGTHLATCETCGGRGEVQSVQRTFLGQVVSSRPCPACQGYGTVIPHPCPTCAGDGRVRTRRILTVKIPAGVEDGMRIRLAQQGEVGPGGGPPATCTSRSTSARTTSTPARATTCTAGSPCR